MSQSDLRIFRHTAVLLVLVALVAMLWSAVGLNAPAQREEWFIYADFGQTLKNGTFSYAHFSIELLTRPFHPLTWLFVYSFTTENFFGLNLLAATMMLLRSVLLYGILKVFFPKQPLIGAGAALLLVIIPLDVGYFRVWTMHWLVVSVLYLGAVYLGARLWRQGIQGWGWLTLTLMMALEVFAGGTYEAIYPLLLATPFCLWLVAEQRITRRWFWGALLWWFPAALMLIFVQYPAYVVAGDYQKGIADSALTLEGMINRIITVYLNGLWRNWRGALYYDATVWLVPRLFITTLATLSLFWFVRLPQRAVGWRWLIGWGLTGLIVLGAGFIIYVPSLPIYFESNIRIYYFAVFGVAIFFATVLWMLSQWLQRSWLFALGVSVLIFLGSGWMLNRAALPTAAETTQIASLLQTIVQARPRFEQNVMIVVESDVRLNLSIFWSKALGYLYDIPDPRFEFCFTPCDFGQYPLPALFFHHDGQATTLLLTIENYPEYQPQQWVDPTAPLPPRVWSVFTGQYRLPTLE